MGMELLHKAENGVDIGEGAVPQWRKPVVGGSTRWREPAGMGVWPKQQPAEPGHEVRVRCAAALPGPRDAEVTSSPVLTVRCACSRGREATQVLSNALVGQEHI